MLETAAGALSWRARVTTVLGALVLGFASQVMSAEVDADEDDDLELAEVQVTGTRIQVPGTYTGATPMTSITGEEMATLGIVNVADALTVLVPQNVSTYMPSMIGDDQSGSGGGGMDSLDRGSFFIGNTIANLRGLDPTFGSRTLTMVDGRRVVSTSNQADVVDLNIIPSNLLERMDVVTGGASSTYGSGAMAGVVNLVLNRRLSGINLDMDYGINEAGDGGSPHISLSGGTAVLGGKGHVLVGLEWQDSRAIRDCASARDWCAESRTMLTNSTGSTQDVTGLLASLPGFEGLPARFQMDNQRYSQFAPSGTLYHANTQFTSGYRFNADGTDVEEYAYGFRGGTGRSTINGDGPLTTTNTPLRPSSDRKTMFTNFEYDFSPRTTGYLQTNLARTTSENRNAYTQGNYCVRFNTMGSALVAGGSAAAGDTLFYGGGSAVSFDYDTGEAITHPERSNLYFVANFRAFLGYSVGVMGAPSGSAPYWVSAANFATYGATSTTPPNITFANGTATYRHVRNNDPNTGTEYWLLWSITLSSAFDDPGSPAVLPELGRNAYAFLNNLSPEALFQVQNAFGTSSGNYGALTDQNGTPLSGFLRTASGGASTGLDTLYGPNACNGFTAMRKVWNPQVEQWTERDTDTMRLVSGVRGRFGGDWRWEGYVQYGKTDSTSVQNNVATNLRLAMAMDAVIDDRPGSPTFGQPICRITRDGPPVLDYEGLPLSNPEELQALAEGCTPINIFGYEYSDPDAAALQQQAIDYAFVESASDGNNSLSVASFSTSGTLWHGWAGPLTGAFGLEYREDKVNNNGTRGVDTFYERADLARTWADGFGGNTRVSELYTELNMPIASGIDGINLFSVNVGLRYANYKNKGGAGTTGQSASQNTTNWKFQTVFEPFDWVRLRMSRSRDLRAAGYRDLFLNQPGLPDQFSGTNPWRERSAFSDENQSERWGQVRVGNPDLNPEKSDTLTLGLVLSPGGWAQGMRLSVDYYNIRVKDGISFNFRSGNPIQACWEESGNIPAVYFEDGTSDPDQPGVNGLFNDSLASCQDITFGVNDDGSRNLEDILTYNSSRPINALPYQRRGIDLSWNYNFPLNRMLENLPGSVSLTLRGQRAMESSGTQVLSSTSTGPNGCAALGGTSWDDFNCYIPRDLVGQIRSSTFIPGVAASPKWTGNIITSYRIGSLSTSLSARYIGGANLDNTWCDNADCANYVNEFGQYLNGSVDNNRVKPYFNFSLNGSYNVQVSNMKQFQIFGSVNNLFDKSPPFTGGGISGASSQYHDTMGRAYRFGVRMKF